MAEHAVPVYDPSVDQEQSLDTTWKVVVWNDPVNLFDYVIFVLRKLFDHTEDKAYDLTFQVHTRGRAIVNDGPRERSEMDCYRLHQYGLWATLEQ